LHAINTNENLIGLVNRNGVSIHHVVNCDRISRLAFILGERGSRMVNRWCAAANFSPKRNVPREPHVKSRWSKTCEVKGLGKNSCR
jgi:hypothetical protein